MMIEGNGFFQVDMGDEFAYTRDGAFQTNADGDLVTVSTGYRLEPAINIPIEATGITISPQGTLSYLLPGQTDPVEEQIEIAIFQNSSGLRQLGENLYAESIASGPPVVGNPGEDGAPSAPPELPERIIAPARARDRGFPRASRSASDAFTRRDRRTRFSTIRIISSTGFGKSALSPAIATRAKRHSGERDLLFRYYRCTSPSSRSPLLPHSRSEFSPRG